MGLASQQQVRQMYVGLDYPGHASVSALEGGTNGDLALLSADGTAPAAGENFKLLKKNNKGIVISSKSIAPANVLYSKSVQYAAPVLGTATVSAITANANTLYTIEVTIKQFGSYSPENEYVKKAFYKAATGDVAENIIDGLIQSLARNFSREEPVKNSTIPYRLTSATYVDIADNVYFDFVKDTVDGTAEISTVTFTQATDEEVVDSSVTLDGQYTVLFSIPTGQAISVCAIAVRDAVNASSAPYTATAAAGVCTITADFKRAETDATIVVVASNYATDAAPTVATGTPGVAGTAFSLSINEKTEWVDNTFDPDKKTRENIDYFVNAVFTTLPTIANTGSKVAVGSGKQVAAMEHYLKGERNDYMRSMGYPHNLNNTYDAVLASNYNYIEIGHYEEGRDEAKKSKQTMTIALPFTTLGANTTINTLITNLNTVLGAGSITALPTS